MNSIRQIQALNKKELEAGVSPSGSWHRDYDSAWIYIGGLPFELSEGDIVTIFSQFGEPVHINLVRDKDTGKSKGFAFLKYEDQRSTDLAVDNLGGAKILERIIRVDHSNYKKKDGEDLSDNTNGALAKDGVDVEDEDMAQAEDQDKYDEQRPLLKEEIELARLIQDHDPEDPMKDYLVQQKREEVEAALNNQKLRSHHRSHRNDRDHKRHKRSRRDRNEDSDEDGHRPGHRHGRDRHRSLEKEDRDRSYESHRKYRQRSRNRSDRHRSKERQRRSSRSP